MEPIRLSRRDQNRAALVVCTGVNSRLERRRVQRFAVSLRPVMANVIRPDAAILARFGWLLSRPAVCAQQGRPKWSGNCRPRIRPITSRRENQRIFMEVFSLLGASGARPGTERRSALPCGKSFRRRTVMSSAAYRLLTSRDTNLK